MYRSSKSNFQNFLNFSLLRKVHKDCYGMDSMLFKFTHLTSNHKATVLGGGICREEVKGGQRDPKSRALIQQGLCPQEEETPAEQTPSQDSSKRTEYRVPTTKQKWVAHQHQPCRNLNFGISSPELQEITFLLFPLPSYCTMLRQQTQMNTKTKINTIYTTLDD